MNEILQWLYIILLISFMAITVIFNIARQWVIYV